MAEVIYTIVLSEDIYTITNQENTPVSLTLTEIDDCTKDTTVVVASLEKDTPYILPLSIDGKYKVNLLSSEFAPNESNIYIDYYLNLEKSMIEDIFSVLCSCDCGCANCVDLSVDQYQALLTTRTKIDVYKHLTAPRYTASFDVVHAGTSCLIEPQLYCDIAVEGVVGTIQYNSTLTKQLIALDYLAMYFTALKGLTEQTDIDYINLKWKADAILCCINSLGINIKDIQTLIENMAGGTITSGVYTNLPPTDVGFLDIDVANRVVDYPFTMTDFTENVASYPPLANDPNPDPANNVFFALRIESLLAGAPEGMLEYNGVDVVVGQVIEFSNIALLTYTSPDTDAVDVDTFTYSISNVGAPTTFIS